METISREELKAKLDSGHAFKLVMAMDAWAFEAKHIPGSINVSSNDRAQEFLSLEDEIIVYCSSPECFSSQNAYNSFVKQGFKNVRRFIGGIDRWEEAGFPLEGTMVE